MPHTRPESVQTIWASTIRRKGALRCTASLLAYALTVPAIGTTVVPALAQTQGAQNVEEIVVTGTRVVRDGYQAPTPLTVVGIEEIESQAQPNIADFVNTLPTFQGSATPGTSQSSISNGTAGVNTLNLRALGNTRTLVLFDGQRSVGSILQGSVDINTFPQALIQRVDVVTGGASAAYGSDALSGVVNFILDRDYTGIKGELAGGITTYGDNANWRAELTGGTPFAAGRGHFLISGELTHKDGIMNGNRDWNLEPGYGTMINPAYGTGPGQSRNVPERIIVDRMGGAGWAAGGLITSGPLKGIAFGAGGAPYMHVYGDLVSGTNMRGGDWKSTQIRDTHGQSIDSRQSMRSIFTRLSYDVRDNVEVFVQAAYNKARVQGISSPNFNPANITIRGDYGFMPPEIFARAQALGLTTIQIGTMHPDIDPIGSDNTREVTRWVYGANGDIDMFGSSWAWDAYYQSGISRSETIATSVYSRSRFLLAIDAVRGPSGTVVCRSALTVANGCVPWNLMGIGVNSQAAVEYIMGEAWRHEKLSQKVAAVSVSGEPFELWAGPVSLAFGAEHRREEVSGTVDEASSRNDWYAGNYLPNFGKYHVTEGFIETVVPLATDEDWARSLELNGAVRATDYSTSGFVTTWKIGATWSPVDDLRFRVTRSRDIRAPHLGELFASGTANTNIVLDPFNGNVQVAYQGLNRGNPNLLPEKADTVGVGVVVQPSFLPGFQASADFFDIEIKDAIGNVGAQDIVNFCFEGNQAFCPAIIRGVVNNTNVIQQIRISPFNLAVEIARGIDFEASYRAPLAEWVDGWDGDLTVRAFATRMLKDYQDNSINVPTDDVGAATAKWKWTASLSYNLEPFRATFSARGVSDGRLFNTYILCTTDCPISTTQNPTANFNHREGNFYLDTSFTYRFLAVEDGIADMDVFLNIRNLLNKDPGPRYPGPASPFYQLLADCGQDDCQGRVFRAGVRFRR
ncbi:MAG: TonB-dependent receptor plug domain-containing protein [Rhodospirillaceae bacterium]